MNSFSDTLYIIYGFSCFYITSSPPSNVVRMKFQQLGCPCELFLLPLAQRKCRLRSSFVCDAKATSRLTNFNASFIVFLHRI